ncbi:TPA: ATP-dependent RNA helicase, partial [Vibrio vulnificus]|nr:ATP-dependent RNA helicase [Vibrio vulnificus]
SSVLAAILLKRQQGKRPLFYIGEDPMIEAIERDKQNRRERRESRDNGGRRESFNSNQDWDTYQLQVGREQGVQVKDIVGALANELGLGKGSIGAIKLAQEHTFVQLPKAMSTQAASKLRKLRIRQKEVGAVVCDFNDFNENRGRRDGARREGGFREGGRREGGYRGNREGNREGGREGGYRGNREGGREGGFRGNREGERRFDRNRGGDHRGNHRGERGHGRPRRNED